MATDLSRPAPTTGAPSDSVLELRRQVAAGYFALQAVSGVVLWALIFTSATVRSGFEVVDDRPAVTDAFFWADVAVVVVSAVAAAALWRARPWGVLAAAAALGGVAYPTVFLLGYVTDTGGTASVALGVMIVVTVLCAWATTLAWRSRPSPG